MGLIYDKKTKRYYQDYEILTPRELESHKKRIKNAMRAADARLETIEQDKIQRGYCPKCRFLLPTSGECDCGYKKPKALMNIKIQAPQKNYVNPEILKMYK